MKGQVAPDDWDRHWQDIADAETRNPAARMRFAMVPRLLGIEPGQPCRVLDVGSGQGDLLASIVAAHPAVDAVGLELSRAGVEIAIAKVPRARFIQRDLLQPGTPLPELRGWATHATCSEVLEHVDDPASLLRNATEFMASGCRLVVTVPGGPMSAFDRHIGHRGHFTSERLRKVLESAGLTVDRAGSTGFPFFNLYRLMVIARGPKLVEDIAAGRAPGTSRTALLVLRLFGLLFRLNVPVARFGWQIVAVAHKPLDDENLTIRGTRISALRRGWDHLPGAVRRPVIRLMRREAIRSTVLSRLGVRPEREFLTLSNGGPEVIEVALSRLMSRGTRGDYYEFGVFRGYTLWQAQRSAVARGLSSMRFFGFDSFEGLPEVHGADGDAGIFVPGDYRCTRADVEGYLDAHGFDWDRGTLVEGFFDTSLTPEIKRQLSMGPAALVMVDCDLYQSTVPVLSFVADLLQEGTILLFDDWYCFGEAPDSGEPRAFREFLAAHPEWHANPFATFGTYGRAFEVHRRQPGQEPSMSRPSGA